MTLYKLLIQYGNHTTTVHAWGNKRDLYAIIGHIYSNSLLKIDRIDYKEIHDNGESRFTITPNGLLINNPGKEV